MSSKSEAYRVLARKYRPQNFDELIGQDALVRTLKNAIDSGRIAHAFMLSGVRGVGKTTTARIIAKALNYTGADGNAGPTTESTDDCKICQAIAEDRHPDVIEMDAASRTGVDDIREILDGVRYAPTEARYKVYIIDEIHMLSKQAFNALLKTLEEPPEHVKFIFATTEIRKVPVTVLSRCQRFDLRRVDVPTLEGHFQKICDAENVKIEEEALSQIARAADGSVRDGLSLLDQAITLTDGNITSTHVHDMLGLADRTQNLNLLEHALSGNMPEALEIMDQAFACGNAPVLMIQDLLDLTHFLTRMRAVPDSGAGKQAMADAEIKRAEELAKNFSMPTLGKTWKILLKGLGEVQNAPNPQSAAEMVIIRLAYAADLPDPADLIKKLQEQENNASEKPGGGDNSSQPSGHRPTAPVSTSSVGSSQGGPSRTAVATAPAQDVNSLPEKAINSLQDIVCLLEEQNEHLLASQVFQFVHLVKMEYGRLEIRLKEEAPPKLSQDLGRELQAMTGRRWMISISGGKGALTLAEQAEALKKHEFKEMLETPIIKEIMEIFPGAELTDIIKENGKEH